MKRGDFTDYVRGAVRAGGTVKVKGVADELGIDKGDAKTWLEAMYEDGELELDLDDDDGFIYRRGDKLREGKNAGDKLAGALVPLASSSLANAAKDAVKEQAKEALLGSEDDDPNKKKVLWGIGLGFVLPGFGLFYSAPWLTAVLASLGVGAVAALLYLISAIPILGGMLSYIVFGVLMLASGILGGVYTWQYNKNGERTRLSKGSEGRKALPF